MKFIVAVILFGAIFLGKLPLNTSALFNTTPQPYIEILANLTTTTELAEFFDVQSVIYIDNTYDVYQKFLYKMLGDLPRSERAQDIKQLVAEIEKFLAKEGIAEKLRIFDKFVDEHPAHLNATFEYDTLETKLTADDFTKIFKENDIEAVLHFINFLQLQEFMKYTSNGIKMFLILNRPYFDKQHILDIKYIVDTFLQRGEFIEKRQILKILLRYCRDII